MIRNILFVWLSSISLTILLSIPALCQNNRNYPDWNYFQNHSFRPNSFVDIRLLSEWIKTDSTYLIGVEINLEPGWKTYWRIPDPFGIPMTLDFIERQNIQSGRIIWPSPNLFDYYGTYLVGYDGDVVFPIELRATDPQSSAFFKAILNFGICKDICIPYQQSVELGFPAISEERYEISNSNSKIAQALDNQPLIILPDANMYDQVCQLININDDQFIVKKIKPLSIIFQDPMVIIFESVNNRVMFEPGNWLLTDDGLIEIRSRIAHISELEPSINLSNIRITIVTNNQTVEFPRC